MSIDKQEQVDGHLQRNEMLKDSLRKKGVKLNELRSVELHFWAFSKKNAVMLAKALYDQGLLVLALAPAPDNERERWNIEAGFKDTVDNLTSQQQVKRFVELAAQFDSLYDGWGTLV